jgi:hypothetical protein
MRGSQPISTGTPSAVLRHAMLGVVLSACAACGGGPPFNSYDPPPTFAYRYDASDPRSHDAGALGGILDSAPQSLPQAADRL